MSQGSTLLFRTTFGADRGAYAAAEAGKRVMGMSLALSVSVGHEKIETKGKENEMITVMGCKEIIKELGVRSVKEAQYGISSARWPQNNEGWTRVISLGTSGGSGQVV